MGLFKRNGDGARGEEEVVPEVASGTPSTISGTEMRRLWADGLPGIATIIDTRDTGERLSGNTVLDLELSVARDGVEPYEATLRLPVVGDDTSPYAAGAEYNVRVDPQDRNRLTFSA